MREVGSFSIYFAHLLCLWGIVVSFLAFYKKDKRAKRSSERTFFAIFLLNLLSVAILIWAFISDNFTFKYVYEYSSRSQPFVYKITALWGGMEGSLLFWEFLLSLLCVASFYVYRKNVYNLLPFSSFVMFLVQGFFLFLVSFKTNPFNPLLDSQGNIATLKISSLIDGNGLNPLLQNFYMAIHPPLLYLGFVGFTIPFSYILAVVWEREKKPLYMVPLRFWTLFSWLTLSMGILSGSYWAYLELGWGGYWGWDPVENASLIPWLTLTALLHSLSMEKKWRIFKPLNYILIVATFLLSIYGTYLTRSGVLQSVHSFGVENPSVPFFLKLGNLFLAFIFLMVILSVSVASLRIETLKSKGKIKSSFSQETMVFYGIILFIVFAFVVFYGVTSPIFYKIFIGKELFNGAEFYNSKSVPLTLAILLTMAIASISPCGKGNWREIKKRLLFPTLFGFFVLFLGLFYIKSQNGYFEVLKEKKVYFYFMFLFFISGFSSMAIFLKYLKSVLANRKKIQSYFKCLYLSLRENPSKYGGYTVHFGIIVFCIGVAFSSVFQKSYSETLNVGESVKIDGVIFSLAELKSDNFSKDIEKVNILRIWAKIDLFKNSKYIGTLMPMRVHYKSTIESNQPPSYEVAIKSSIFKDYYLVLGGFDLMERKATVTFFVNPFIALLWIGSVIILMGGIVAIIPQMRSK